VNRENPDSVFRHVYEPLSKATVLLGNLESPHCHGGTRWQKGNMGAWKSEVRNLDPTIKAGFHAVSTTNNHILDYGHDGLLETLSHLDAHGIKHAGAGRNLAEAHAPAIVERPGFKVAMLAYTTVFCPGWEATAEGPGLAALHVTTSYEPHPRHHETPGKPPKVRTFMVSADKDRVAKDIAAARAQADIVICSFHWGVSEGYEKLTEYQPELGHHAIDSGADLVFGHHPHLIQGIEVYRGKAIFYSLGNFTFARQNPASGHELENLVARCVVRDKKIAEVQYLPVRTDDGLAPHIISPRDGADIVAIVNRRSAAFGTQFYNADDAVGVKFQSMQNQLT
jgi:poly-gamma-glutamate synthesis protein (capsule biosynthesis protein)